MLDHYMNTRTMMLFAILISCLSLSFVLFFSSHEKVNASVIEERSYPESAVSSPLGPFIKDPALKAELFFKGLAYPTDMEFLDSDNILVTEKDTGIVWRIVNGMMVQEPLLDVKVETFGHRGLLGIDIDNHISNNNNTLGNNKSANNSCINSFSSSNNANIGTKYVFIYYTAAQKGRRRRYHSRGTTIG